MRVGRFGLPGLSQKSWTGFAASELSDRVRDLRVLYPKAHIICVEDATLDMLRPPSPKPTPTLDSILKWVAPAACTPKVAPLVRPLSSFMIEQLNILQQEQYAGWMEKTLRFVPGIFIKDEVHLFRRPPAVDPCADGIGRWNGSRAAWA